MSAMQRQTGKVSGGSAQRPTWWADGQAGQQGAAPPDGGQQPQTLPLTQAMTGQVMNGGGMMGGQPQPQQQMPAQQPQNPLDRGYLRGLAQDDPISLVEHLFSTLGGPTGFAEADRMGETFGPGPQQQGRRPAPAPMASPKPDWWE